MNIFSDSKLNIRPVFLIRGPQGCGKYRLVETLTKRKGIHLVSFCFSETRTLATAQKETRIRTTLQNSLDCTPCILLLQNIEARLKKEVFYLVIFVLANFILYYIFFQLFR